MPGVSMPSMPTTRLLLLRLLIGFALVTGLAATATAATTAVAGAQSVMTPSDWFDAGDGDVNVHFYFFWSESCPHCREAHPFIDTLPDKYPWLILHSHEVSSDAANAQLYADMAARAGNEASYVPAFIFCGGMTTGYDAAETTGAALAQALESCHSWALENRQILLPAASVARAATLDEAEANAPGDAGTAPIAQGEGAEAALPADAVAAVAPAIALPLIGELSAESLSLPALTLTIAGLDAFNPCAFFVLMFLLSLMVHAGSRKRMLLIGGTFVFFSGLIYFIFMTAWLNVFLWIGELKAITMVAGLIAIVIALINIKDYFWFKQGVSLSIPERAKPGIYQRSRSLLKASSLPAMLAGTAVLAIAANSYELLCTSGFPMVYTRALTLHDLSTPAFYAYLAAYNIVYVIPLFIIVALFTAKFGARKLTEQQGRVLKLLSGLMMLFLGVLLVVAPDALNQVATAFGLLLAAVVLTALIVAIDRRLHPTDRRKPHPV
jgi:thiol-disulfide isomerase/thioredoxin